ncbi:Pyruvate synthase subunit porC [uncultured Clostridium sp.]|uniref:2-oxoacid:acceptor oxidoreductase family protein n=1 Tax=uncultured Clostridium sp. TaxID=59620 RepID=UPI0008213E17|nr:2-oxoacid:acceptor oxidoreductase family protein [uncultured Clostridium sp.]SCK04252.1 Pyruvate synthase subunit porC [uncultured Clostridium sp.]
MNEIKIIFAGFGGQGIQTMGKLTAYSGLDSGLNVSWLPSYGPEMRGGTSNCSVILSNGEIGSPVVTSADIVIAMNNPSLEKFENYIKSNGILIIDSELVRVKVNRKDITILKIPAETLSLEIGDKRYANMIILGALIKVIKTLDLESVIKSINIHGKEKYYTNNKLALEKGFNYII